MRRPSRGRGGYAPAFFVIGLPAGVFLLMVAWFSFHWAGVIVLAVVLCVAVAIVRSEIRHHAIERQRADEALIRRYVAHTAAPARRQRRTWGGAR